MGREEGRAKLSLEEEGLINTHDRVTGKQTGCQRGCDVSAWAKKRTGESRRVGYGLRVLMHSIAKGPTRIHDR